MEESDTDNGDQRNPGRCEVAIETDVEFRKRPPSGGAPGAASWIERMNEASASTEPLVIEFEGRRFVWHPGSRDVLTTVSVMVDDMNDDQEERRAMRRFLSALSYEYHGAVVIKVDVGTNLRRGELDMPVLHQPPVGAVHHHAPQSIALADTSDELSLCLALMREAMSSNSQSLAFLSFWKIIEVLVGSDNQTKKEWIGDEFDHLNETRIAAAHAIPFDSEALLYHPDDPTLSRRLHADIGTMHELATKAISERWPRAVIASGLQFT